MKTLPHRLYWTFRYRWFYKEEIAMGINEIEQCIKDEQFIDTRSKEEIEQSLFILED